MQFKENIKSQITCSRPIKQYAVWLLGRREWSEKELRSRLKLKGYESLEIDDCLIFCQQHGFQSDERFAQSRTRLRSKSRGNRVILRELSQKGIDEEISNEVIIQTDDEFDRAMNAVKRYSDQELTIKLKAKIWRFLLSRGFPGDIIKLVIKQL